jgi:Mg-chelatase subunit ChlD
MLRRAILGSVLPLGLCLSAICNLAIVGSVGQQAVFAAESAVKSHEKEVSARPHMDLAFCIDTTGSMQGEIDMVKAKTKSLVAQLSTGKPSPIVRVGVVAYRDIGDQYVTKVFPFSDDIDKVVKDISELKADGGGDGPEAVDRGLHAAIKELKWGSDKHTAKILFLIGDAGPHGVASDLDWRADCRAAIASGIQINTIGCAGLESYSAPSGVDVFKQIAHLADGKFESLAYRQETVDSLGRKSTIVNAGGATYALSRSVTAGDGWKKEVSAGSVRPIAPPTGMAMAAAPASAPRLVRAKMSTMMAGAGGSLAESSYAPAGRAVATPLLGSRSDNNLDDIMLRDARERANSVLK